MPSGMHALNGGARAHAEISCAELRSLEHTRYDIERDAARRGPSRPVGHVVVGGIVVFGTQPPAPSVLADAAEGRRLVIVHGLAAVGSGRAPESRLLIADSPDAWTLGCPRPQVGLAVPLERHVIPPLVDSAALAATPIVRLSRPALLELLATPPATSAAVAPVEDLLVGMMQGIIRENPRVVAGTGRDGLVPADLTAMIDARHTDPHFDVAMMARELHVSRRQLYRYAPEGLGLATMLAERRMRTATSVLQEHPHLTLSMVAQLSGFRDAASMRVQFLRRLGITPREYRDVG